MRTPLPPLNWLRTFDAAVRSMSFTAAANELGLTQSAVSQQLRALEHHLGRPLFHRLARGLALTEAGTALAPLVAETLNRLETGAATIFGERLRRSLRVCATASFSILWLARRLGTFRETHPEIDFRLTSSIWPTVQADPALDLDIRFGNGDWAGLCAERLTRDELFPVCSPALLGRIGGCESSADLRRVTLLHTFGFQGDWSQWLEHAHAGAGVDPIAGPEFDLAAVTLDLAERGVGVALGRTCYVYDRIADGRLVAPFEQRLPAGDDFYLVYPNERALTGPALAFRDWLHAVAAPLNVSVK